MFIHPIHMVQIHWFIVVYHHLLDLSGPIRGSCAELSGGGDPRQVASGRLWSPQWLCLTRDRGLEKVTGMMPQYGTLFVLKSTRNSVSIHFTSLHILQTCLNRIYNIYIADCS